MLDQISHALLALLAGLANIVLAVLAWIEASLGAVMTAAHIPPDAQAVLGIIVAVVFLVAAFRLFSGFIRVVLIVFLVALVVHAVGDRGGPHRRPALDVPHIDK